MWLPLAFVIGAAAGVVVQRGDFCMHSRILPAALAAVAIVLLLLRLPAPPRDVGRWPWRTTGLLIGAIGALVWVSGAPAGWYWGLSVTGPARSLAWAVVRLEPEAIGWGGAMLVGIPIGSAAAAYLAGALSPRRIGPREAGRRFSGGALMGVGGTLAAGCNIGNALTGVSILATNSLIATGTMIGGVAIAAGLEGIIREQSARRRSTR